VSRQSVSDLGTLRTRAWTPPITNPSGLAALCVIPSIRMSQIENRDLSERQANLNAIVAAAVLCGLGLGLLVLGLSVVAILG